MRHKWDKTYWDKEGHATCVNCGTVKEKNWPQLLYFVPYDKFTFGTKAPNCDEVKNKVLKSKGIGE